MIKKKAGSVRHTYSNQIEHGQKQPIAKQIQEVVRPVTLTQLEYYHQLGLDKCALILSSTTDLVISLVWRQFAPFSVALRTLKTEGLLCATPIQVSQQAFFERIRTMSFALFEPVLQKVLTVMHIHCQKRIRLRPAEIKWTLQHYNQIWVVNGSTLNVLMRRVCMRPDYPLAGWMTGLFDVNAHLPIHLWYADDEPAHGQHFWKYPLELPSKTILLLNLGFTNDKAYILLMAQQVIFIERCKANAVYQVKQVRHKQAHLCYTIVFFRQDQPLMCLIEVHILRQRHRYLTSELDSVYLPARDVIALYRQSWHIENAYKNVKASLVLAYLWVVSLNDIALYFWATWLISTIWVELTGDIANTLSFSINHVSIAMVHCSLYFCTIAFHQREVDRASILWLITQSSLVFFKRKPAAPTLGLFHYKNSPLAAKRIYSDGKLLRNSSNILFPILSHTRMQAEC